MAKVPGADAIRISSARNQSAPAIRATGADFGAGTLGAVEKVAQTGFNIGIDLREKAFRRDEAGALNELTINLPGELDRIVEEERKNIQPGARGFADAVKTRSEALVQQRLEDVKTRFNIRPIAFDDLTRRVAGVVDARRRTAKLFEAQEGQRQAKVDTDKLTDKLRVGLIRDPSQGNFLKALESAKLVFQNDGGIFTLAEKEKRLRETTRALVLTRFEGLIQQNPGQALAELKKMSPEALAELNIGGAELSTIRRAAKAEQRRRVALNSGEVKRLVRNEVARAETGEGITPAGFADSLKRLGASSETVASAAVLVERAKKRFDTVEGLKFKKPAELASALEALRPDRNSPTFADDLTDFRTIVQRVKLQTKLRDSNPVAFVAKEVDADIARLQASGELPVVPEGAAFTHPAAKAVREKRQELSIERQIGMGVVTPRILSKNGAEKFMERFNAADGTKRVKMISALRDELGPRSFRMATRDLAGADLPPAAILAAIRVGRSGAVDTVSRTLIDSSLVKEEELIPDPKVRRRIKEQTLKLFTRRGQVGSVLANQARVWALPQRVQDLSRFADAIQKYALFIGRNNALGAASTAVRDVLSPIKTIDSTGFAHVTLHEQDGDIDDLKAGLGTLRTKARSIVAFERKRFRKGGVGDREFFDWVADLMKNGTWVDAPDGDGYVLIHPTTRQAIRRADGSRYKVSTAEALGIGVKTRESAARQGGLVVGP